VSINGSGAHVEINLRPFASALPLGFFAFGIGMALLAGYDAGWIAVGEQKHIGILLASFVFPLELLAAIFGFLARDSFAATGLGLFATSWLALGLEFASAPVPGLRNAALGIYLLAFAAAVGALALAAFTGKPLIGVIMLAATGRAILSGIYELGGAHSLLHAGGIVAIAIAGLAWYGGAAFLIEDVRQKTILPTFRRGGSKSTLEGSLSEQIERAAGDAGVRQQL
jgi:uncharacterized protein